MADALLGYPSEIRRGQGNTLTDGIGHFHAWPYSGRLAGELRT